MADDNSAPPDSASDIHPPPSSDDIGTNGGGEGGAGAGGHDEEMKLYIGNIDYSTDDKRLRDAFSKFGTITDCFCPVDRASNRPRGFGFVTFAGREDAMKAIAEMDNTELDGRMIRVSESRPKTAAGGGTFGGGGGEFNASGATEVKLFVGNLAFETDLETIRELFEKEGEVKDCYMPKDRSTDQPRGFAFVTMPAEDAKAAVKKLQGYELDSRTLRIEESMPKRSDTMRGGFGGGGGGRFGRGFGERDVYPPRGGYDAYGGGMGGGGGRDRHDDRGGYGRDRYDRDSYSRRDRHDDRYDDRDSYRGRDRYDDDRGDRSSRDDRGSRYDDRDRKGSKDREDRYRSDRDRERY